MLFVIKVLLLVILLEKALTTTKTIFNYNFYQMKKGLLSILAAATVLVGCQNYDDQFDALNVQITALQQQVNSSITSAISDLQGQLTTLASTNLTTDDLATALVDITAQIDAINDAVADIDGETAELEEEVEEILDALTDLLEANAVIDQNVNIRNTAELEYVESLIGTDEGDPTVIIKGNVLVDGTDLDTAALAARVNAVTNKIRTVIGNVTVTVGDVGITMDTVSFIDGTATLDNTVSIGALATVSGNVSLGHYGDVAVTTLTSVASLSFSNSASITTLSVGNLASGDLATFDYPLATSIVLGDISLTTGTITATSATVFTSGFDGTLTSLSLKVSGTAVVRMSATKITGVVTITGADGTGSEGHFAGLTTIATGGSLVNPAKAVDFSALTTVSGTLTANSISAASFDALATQGGAINTTSAYSFSAPLLKTAALISTHSTATIEVKDLAASTHVLSGTINGLTVAAQTTSLSLEDFPALKVADVTGASTATGTLAVTVNATSTALTTLEVDGLINTLSVTAAPKLATLTTAGNITDFIVADTTTMTTINFGHSFISGDDAATVTVSGVTALTSLDMSSLTKVKTINVVNNGKLATVVAPSSTVLAEPIATISVSLTGNALTGNFDQAVAGTETTSYTMASIESNDLTTLKAFIGAYAAQTGRTASTVSGTSGTANIYHDIDIDVVTIDGGTATNTLSAAMTANGAPLNEGPDAADDTVDDTSDGTGGITTANELAIVTTE